MNIFKKLFDSEYKELQKFSKIADEVEALEPEYQKLSDKELQAKTDEFKKELEAGKTIEDILVPAFAAIREAAVRVFKQRAYYVQLIGGLAIHYGNIAEMKTGEGKTLTTIFPAYVNALTGDGVHVITVNEYLTARNAEWMGPIFNFMGLTVGVNLRELSPQEKRDVYNCDIVYTTNNEVGFDYLRDNMVVRIEDRVQRKLNFAILDEVDSMLIDEARTPLIISGGKFDSASLYNDADRTVKKLKENDDYTLDEKTKNVSLTEEGSMKVEKLLNIDNLYDINNSALVHHINQALKANYGMRKDVDYVIQDGAIIIVDQFTGRLMPGRQFSEGLHQAIEAKENVKINEETRTMATITFQNLFRMYKKLSGMTGTAKTEEEEFRDIYNMYVIEIPTNKPVIREDLADLVYPTRNGKYTAIIDVIKEIHGQGRPILIGTISVEINEFLSSLLRKNKIPHEILNAKNHAREAEIIAKAGEKGAITLATNMAGRGTDIQLTDETRALGGLFVIGTERHESRRIDNQLRGRAGRQGDPGTSQFFVSFEDELMVRFGAEKIKNTIQSLGMAETQAIRSRTFTKQIEGAQKKVEGNNYDMRKHLLDYDNIMNEQREALYERRNEIIDTEDIHEIINNTFKDNMASLIDEHIAPEGKLTDHDLSEIAEYINTNFLKKSKVEADELKGKKEEEVVDYLNDLVINDYNNKVKDIPDEMRKEFEKSISLRVIDTTWVEHINTMEHLRESMNFRQNPLQTYTLEGYEAFENTLKTIDSKISVFLLRMAVNQNVERKQTITGKANDGKETLKAQPKKSTKVGRNDPCPCGSGKKYKQCCGK